MTVVLDTNVVVAALVAHGLCHEVLHRAVRLRVLAASVPLMDELEITLHRKFVITPAVAAFLFVFRQQVRLVTPAALPQPVCRDSDDDVVLGTALAAGADLIVTGDQDLLSLGRFQHADIVSPRQFLERLDAGAARDRLGTRS